MLVRAIALCSGLLMAVAAVAQTSSPVPEPPPPAVTPAPPPAENDDPRYSFHRVQDGYLRLDVRTGQVALCSRRQVGWACQVLPDDRTVLESEIARLQSENGVLKKELVSRGIALPTGVRPPLPPAGKTEKAPKSAESEINRVVSMVEAMWRRLVEMIGNLQRDIMNMNKS